MLYSGFSPQIKQNKDSGRAIGVSCATLLLVLSDNGYSYYDGQRER